jgi:hypothetical protein
MGGATNMEEKLEILHEIEMKKRLIDGLEETHIPIFFRSFGDSEWEMMKELEEPWRLATGALVVARDARWLSATPIAGASAWGDA